MATDPTQRQHGDSAMTAAVTVQSLIESARCLGVAQAKDDQPAIAHWNLQVDALASQLVAPRPDGLAVAEVVSAQAGPAPSVADFAVSGKVLLLDDGTGVRAEYMLLTDHARIVAEKDAEIARQAEHIDCLKIDVSEREQANSHHAAMSRQWHLRADEAEARADALAGVLRDIRPTLVDAANDFAADDWPKSAAKVRADIERIDALLSEAGK